MTPPYPPSHPHLQPDDETETPDVHTVPQGSVAVFGVPRGTPPEAPAPEAAPVERRPDIESPFLDFFGHPTVDGSVVEQPPRVPAQPVGEAGTARGDLSALAGQVPPGRPAAPRQQPDRQPAPPRENGAGRPAAGGPRPDAAPRRTPAPARPEPAPSGRRGLDVRPVNGGRGTTTDRPDLPPAGYEPDDLSDAGRYGAGMPTGADAALPGGSTRTPRRELPAGRTAADRLPTDLPPTNRLPTDLPPTNRRPADLPPADRGPTDRPSTGRPPAGRTAAERVESGRSGSAQRDPGRPDPARGADRSRGTDPERDRAPATSEPARETRPDRRMRAANAPTPPKIKKTDRDPAAELAITEIAGHLTFTPNTVTAWYSLPEVRWAFRPDAEREALLSAIAEQYAGLAGFRLHLRRTTRPFPADEWARTVDQNTPYPLPTVVGAPSWSDHLVAAQHHLRAVNHAEGQSYLGVTFARRNLGSTMSERVSRIFGKGVGEGERARMGRLVEQFDEVLGAFGMRGRRVEPSELEWLIYRSVALGMAPPSQLSPVSSGRWERGDLLGLTEQIERYRTPYGSTMKLVNRLTGEERHVAVLSVGRMEPLEIPERHEPWLHFHERLPWPMELSSRVDVLGPGDSFRNLEHRLRMIRSQQLDYAEHGMDAPPELERLAQRALVIGDDMTTGLPTDASRVHGWHRIAVSGRNREECLERSRRLIQLYSRELRASLQHPKNQEALAREFIPGEPIANTGYLRRMPVTLFAAALPQAASTVGDRRGDLIGRTAGTSRRPVFLDLHFPMEVRERSGLAVFVAEPGGGKSTLLGALGYLAARRGVQVTLLDPSGPLARLAAMPELKPFSRVLNLTGSEQGTLAPYSLIPTPQRQHFDAGPRGDRDFEIAVSNARAERRMLVQDICSMLVPPQVAKEASTATLLRHAVREVPAEETSTLDDVVACLRGLSDHDGRELANLLLDTAEMPLALLFFGAPPPDLLGSDAALTVITMAGLRLPDLKIEREYWSAEEALALPMLHTAHRLAVRRCYGGSMSQRKLVGLDEAHFMEGWRSGRSFLVRLARDSRKWNLSALVSSQNPKDILGLDVQNLVSTVFVGRIAEDSEIAAEALRLLRVPTDVGYEQTLAALSQVDTSSSARLGFREFVMRDVDGRVQKIRVDVSYVPQLLTYLDTTPTGTAPEDPAAQPRDGLDPDLDSEAELDAEFDSALGESPFDEPEA